MKKTNKICEQCSSQNLKTHVIEYPLKIGDKQLNIGRVSVRECMDCHHFKPTTAGQAKINRTMMTFMSLF
jgi:hypothetical protein